MTLPALPSGTWYLLARADDEGTVAELQAGTTAVPLPPATAGTFYLLVVLDADGAVPEYNEANNTAARSIRIQ